MTEADKAYIAYKKLDDEEHDPYEFIGQQIIGILAFVVIVLTLWMIVAAVVLK
tara:strand:+ start:1098 stop:1256 length:159 start_codon:yes stop_codon:yes gene_type:complete